jgi:mannose-6-phosphate isomerase-like protein (cupin superfamily)
VHSAVHVHPAVTQVTVLVAGRLTIRMQEGPAGEAYDVVLRGGQAAISEPGTLIQLRNDGEEPAEVLYIVSPSYVFELEGETVRHDDAILVARTWEELASASAAALQPSRYQAGARRAEAISRLARRKGVVPPLLAAEPVRSLELAAADRAPDRSQIRLLATGTRGGLAHCVLPAGMTSAPVRHRTVEVIWYVLEGAGEIWRGREGETRIDAIGARDSVQIPAGTGFQLRASRDGDLKLLLATMPPWPGPQEAVPASGGFEG